MKNRVPHLKKPFPVLRRPMVDGGKISRRKHLIHALAEIDITRTRDAIRAYRKRTGVNISFFAFFLKCVGEAVSRHKHVQAYRSFFNRLIIFDDVDASVLFSFFRDGEYVLTTSILRAIDKKSVDQIYRELEAFRENFRGAKNQAMARLFSHLPYLLRKLFYFFLFGNPFFLKESIGTLAVSSLSNFGAGSIFPIPAPQHNLQLTLGGRFERAVVEKQGVTNHKFLNVTISFDHDIVDGVPATLFINTLKDLIEDPRMLEV